MKQQVVELLIARAGLNQEKAEQVFDTVLAYIKEHPHQLTAVITHLGADSLAGKVGGFFG